MKFIFLLFLFIFTCFCEEKYQVYFISAKNPNEEVTLKELKFQEKKLLIGDFAFELKYLKNDCLNEQNSVCSLEEYKNKGNLSDFPNYNQISEEFFKDSEVESKDFCFGLHFSIPQINSNNENDLYLICAKTLINCETIKSNVFYFLFKFF